MTYIQKLVDSVRKFRSVHRYVGISVAFFLLIVSVTGLVLGWKKDVALLQPVTSKGLSGNLGEWKSFAEIASAAQQAVDSLGISKEIDRMDVRPGNGIVKVLFKAGYWEAQVDGQSGKVLSVAKRHADWIEHLHDGSLFSDTFKLIYINFVGIGLFLLAVSGIWLWYGPKAIRRAKES